MYLTRPTNPPPTTAAAPGPLGHLHRRRPTPLPILGPPSHCRRAARSLTRTRTRSVRTSPARTATAPPGLLAHSLPFVAEGIL